MSADAAADPHRFHPTVLDRVARRVVEGVVEGGVDAPVDRTAVRRVIDDVEPLLSRDAVDALATQVLADVHGLGPLDALLEDPAVSDVMVVGGRGIWVERGGRLEARELRLSSRDVRHLIDRIIAPLGLRIDRSSPMVDARLPDGSRVHAVIEPLAIDGPCLTIRRFGNRAIPLEELATPVVANVLRQAVAARQNIVVSGGTGAGKTTLLNALAAHIDDAERIVTIEDAAELRLPLPHVVRLESRPANSEGVGRVTIGELLRTALRMRPDRIIVGEVRGVEALDMLQAMNTGHEGSLSTCHANSPIDALRRIETMVMMGHSGLPLAAVRQQVMASIDLVVQIARTRTQQRLVTEVAEVGADREALNVLRITNRDALVNAPMRRRRRALARP